MTVCGVVAFPDCCALWTFDVFWQVVDHILLLLTDPTRQSHHPKLHHIHRWNLTVSKPASTLGNQPQNSHLKRLEISAFCCIEFLHPTASLPGSRKAPVLGSAG